MHTDMTAVTIQSNKIVLNEIKRQLSTTRAILWKKPNELFGQPNRIVKKRRGKKPKSSLEKRNLCLRRGRR